MTFQNVMNFLMLNRARLDNKIKFNKNGTETVVSLCITLTFPNVSEVTRRARHFYV